jgi:hypothetical protein
MASTIAHLSSLSPCTSICFTSVFTTTTTFKKNLRLISRSLLHHLFFHKSHVQCCYILNMNEHLKLVSDTQYMLHCLCFQCQKPSSVISIMSKSFLNPVFVLSLRSSSVLSFEIISSGKEDEVRPTFALLQTLPYMEFV